MPRKYVRKPKPNAMGWRQYEFLAAALLPLREELSPADYGLLCRHLALAFSDDNPRFRAAAWADATQSEL